MVLRHVAQEGCLQQRSRTRAEPDADWIVPVLRGQRGASAYFRCLKQDLSRSRNDVASLWREVVLLANAIDQAHAEIFLKGLDATAERWLCQVHGVCRSTKGVVL